MDWGALVGAFIGAGIPAWLAYVRVRRDRQWSTAEVLGPALLALEELDPTRRTMSVGPVEHEEQLWTEFRGRVRVARERLLVLSAGHPRQDVRALADRAQALLGRVESYSKWAVTDLLQNKTNPEWMDTARQEHEAARQALRDLVAATFTIRRSRRPVE